MGWILGAFAFGYALFQIPWGWAGDRFGPRVMLTLAMLGWAAFTMLHGDCPFWAAEITGWNLVWAFADHPFLTGPGGCQLPKCEQNCGELDHKSPSAEWAVVCCWRVLVPAEYSPPPVCCNDAAMGLAIFLHFDGSAGSHGGSACGSFRDESAGGKRKNQWRRVGHPGKGHPSLNPHSFRISGTPWRKIFSSRSRLGIDLQLCLPRLYPYIYFTWFFIYLTRVRGFTVIKGSLWGATPFIAMTLMAPLGGWLSDKLWSDLDGVAGGRVRIDRHDCSALLLWSGSHAANNIFAVLLLAAAAGFSTFAARVGGLPVST